MQSISDSIIRYSARSIEPTFGDRHTPVETWTDLPPYALPLEVVAVDGGYISIDNRRLFSTKKYSLHETVTCFVHQSHDPPTDLMKDHSMDLLELVWEDGQHLLHRLTLRAATIEGVMIIRCASQDSSFPFFGQLQPDPLRGPRTFDSASWKIKPASAQASPKCDDFIESFLAADGIFVRVMIPFNVYHRRDDLRQLIQDRPDLFRMVGYECSNHQITLQSRDEKKDDMWPWDDLFAALAEAEANSRAEYEAVFFNNLNTV